MRVPFRLTGERSTGWPMRSLRLVVLLATVAAACAEAGLEVDGGVAPPPTSSLLTIPACDDVPRIAAPEGAYRPTPIYVANEMPVEEVRAWAGGQPGFEAIWVDRHHQGWITLAFSEEADARQADLAGQFPGVGVVAVAVEWTAAELEALHGRVVGELETFLTGFAVGTALDRGVVAVEVGVLTDEVRSQVEARFAGERVCLDGGDPATLPAPGPQPTSGDGWRLVADEPHVGEPYRTGIATDPGSLRTLWARVGVPAPVPEIDFDREVVIWFGAVFGSSCPGIRLDDVIVDGTTVYALVVLPEPPAMCTADANPHAYLVAVERSKLPPGPFAIQLDADGPSPGWPEERTLVEVDLSRPGAIASSDQVGPDPNLPEPDRVDAGEIIEPGFPVPFELYVHCGIEWLGELNGYIWRTDEPMPATWRALVGENEIVTVELVLLVEPDPMIEASAGGTTVTYRPTTDPMPGCD